MKRWSADFLHVLKKAATWLAIKRRRQQAHMLRAGRLVVPRYAFLGNHPPTDPDTPEGFANRAGVIFSDDAGATWAEGAWLPSRDDPPVHWPVIAVVDRCP